MSPAQREGEEERGEEKEARAAAVSEARLRMRTGVALADDVAPRLVLDLLEGRGERLLVRLRELAEQRHVLEELLVVGRVGL